MKKRNFKFYLSALALFVVALALSACAPKGTLQFNEQQITMGVNQELEIKNLVTLNGVAIEDITFESSAPNVVAVTPRQTIVAGASGGFAILTAKGYMGCLEIIVSGVAREFTAPTNVHFNQATGCIEWDNVYSGNVVANNFKLLISKDGENSEVVVNKNFYKLDDYGKFDVCVSCMERGGIKESSYSDVYSFTKLSAPYNLEYNSNTNTLTWQANSDVSAYYVKKDGVLSERLTNRNFIQELKEEKSYTISVISANAVNEDNVFGSESEELILTRLKAPSLNMQNGLLTWTDNQEGVSGYNVFVYQIINDSEQLVTEQTITRNGSSYSYTPSIESGTYLIRVNCIGDGDYSSLYNSDKHYLNSAQTSSSEFCKLEKPTLLFDKEKLEFSVLNFNPSNDLDLQLNVSFGGQLQSQLDMSAEGKLVYNFNNAGQYSFALVNKAKTAQQVDSVSDEIQVIKLGQITSARQSVDAGGNYTINGLVLNFANQFSVEKINNGISTPLVNSNNKYGLASELFDSAGEYQIVITASGNDYSNNYILSSQTSLTVKRLKTAVLVDDGSKIVWDSVGEDSGIIYKYEIAGAYTDQGSTTNTFYEYNFLPAGAYSMKVYSSSSTIGDGKTLILDAFDYASINFEIFKQLSNPTLSVTRSESGYNLNITPVNNANRYYVQVNSYSPIYENHDEDGALVVPLNEYLQTGEGENGQTFHVTVKAMCTYNIYHTDSDNAELTLEKIPVAKTFTVSEDETVLTEKPYEYISSYQIFINDVETSTLAESEQEFTVKIKYISDLQKYDNTYYLDSDFASFKLVRTTVTVKVNGLTISWNASETSQTYSAKLYFTQMSNSYNIDITNLNNINLGILDLKYLGFDMSKGIKGYIDCKFDDFEGTIAGSYKNGKFESGTDGVLSQYYIGNSTNNMLLKYADANIDINVQEVSDSLNVSWQAVTGASYSLFDGLTEHNDLTTSSVELDIEDYTNAKQYVMSLTQTTTSLQTIYVFFVNRLKPITSLTVNQDETLGVESQTGAEKAVITKDGNMFDNLNDVGTGSSVVTAKYLAMQNVNSYTFYLDSAEKTYTFTRLSPLNVVSNLNIYNNIITWAKEGTAPITSYSYLIKFFDEHGGQEIVSQNAENSNSIDLTEDKYQNILSTLSGNKYVSIQKYVGEFVASDSEINYLSSEYSAQTQLKIITAPQNVDIKATDERAVEQDELYISWTQDTLGVEISGYVICIEHNGVKTEIETTGFYTISKESDLFKAEGVWSVKVKAIGANDSIVSNYSETVEVKRLKTATELAMNKAGTITWSSVEGVKEYKIVYSYTKPDSTIVTNSISVSKDNLTTSFFESCIHDDFDGTVTLTLYALGDGQNTLTSIKTASIVKLSAPIITIEKDRLIVENYSNYSSSDVIFVTGTINSHIVLNQEITLQKGSDGKYYWPLPTEFTYVNEQGQTVQVDSSVQQVLTLTVTAKNNGNSFLNSNSTVCNMEVLSAFSNLRFVRDESGVIHFMADNANSSTTGLFSLGTFNKTFNGNIDFALTDDVLENFAKNWQVTVQAIGDTSGAVKYINSKIQTISGTKLDTIKTISTSEGFVVWQKITGATDYKMCIDETIYLSNYASTTKESLQDAQFVGGDHNLRIRAIGNVTNTATNNNIVLDSDYSFEYTVTKLAELSDFTVKNGYFTFTEVPLATEYVMEVYSDLSQNQIAEYSLTLNTNFPIQESFSYYYSPELLQRLKDYAQLFVKVYNKTTKDNYVYSNYALIDCDGEKLDFIKVARLTNASEKQELYHPTKPDGKNLDYLITIARWEQNAKANNGYILNVDGSLSVTTENNFMLDENCEWSAGNHTISYKQIGSGLTSGRLAYLTADFCLETKVTKLNPVNVELALLTTGTKELCLVYRTVAGADKYYSYLSDVFYKEFNDASRIIMLDELESGKIYDSFGMRAVNTLNMNYIASSINYVSWPDENEELQVVKISKLKTPKQPTFSSGAFYWELSTNSWQTLLMGLLTGNSGGYISDPFELFADGLYNQNFVVKFTSKSTPVKTYSYMDIASKFIYMSDTQRDQLYSRIDLLVSLGSLNSEQAELAKEALSELQFQLKAGFASVQFGFKEFASNLPIGEYTIEISMVGRNIYSYASGEIVAKFSSDFINIGDKYVSVAPNITAVAKDGKYAIEFNNVTVDANCFSSAPSYSLIGVKYNEQKDRDERVELAVVTASGINTSETLAFDLSLLIQNGILDSSFTQLYVTLKGNDSNILNGKPSNVINISILDPIEAKVEHGTIKWRTQQYASKYQVVYIKNGSSTKASKDFVVDETLEWYSWNSAELIETVSYDVSIQACGFVDARINTSEVFRMSGRVTEIGQVTKLANISSVVNGVDIHNGIFTWDSVANATAYDVYYTKTAGNNYEIYLTNYNYFEPIVADTNLYYYYFMAIGTESGILDSASVTYVNSTLSEYNLAQRVKAIEKITFEDGIIKFTPSQGYKTGYYKLSFYKLASNGERGDRLDVFTKETSYDTNQNASLLSYGQYDLEIYALYKDKTALSTNPNAYYVLSYVSKEECIASKTYYKFDAVSDVQVQEGKISWTFNNDGGINAQDYQFRLVFTTPQRGEVVKYVASSVNYFEDVVYDEITTSENITLNIYVWATDITTNNYVQSQAIEYLNIHQYQNIDESKIEISTTEASQLMVDWSKGVQGTLTEGFNYQIKFTANGKVEEFYTTEPRFITGEGNDIEFNIDGDYTIELQIRVIPTINNYISSAWTASKEISRPRSVDNLRYDEEKCIFTWDSYAQTENWNSYKYKIKDEVTYINALGEEVTEVYILTANIGDEKFEPFVMGIHKVSVAVVVSNSASDNFISEYVTIEGAEFSLYESGCGSEKDPFIVANSTHFNNMKYRMCKDGKNNEYFFGTVVDGVTTLNEEKTIVNSTQYYFKQSAHITLTKYGEIDDTLAQVSASFENVYDGDYWSITFNYTHIDNKNDFGTVSLFNTLGTSAVIKNTKLLFSIASTREDSVIYGNNGQVANINVLCQNNNGLISNIVVGEKDKTISIKTYDLILYLSFITNKNSGTVSYVQNYYNIVIEDKYLNNQRSIQFASMAINNQGRIENTKNCGDINITGSNINVGGLVVLNQNGALITAGANIGKITIYYNKAATSYVGGLVAKNDQGELTYGYCTSTFDIKASSSCTANVGGLIGWSVDDKISYSYINVKYTKTLLNFNMYQAVGLLTSSQGNAENVYYKNISNFACVNGTYGSGFISYSTSPTDDGVELYDGDSKFNKTKVDDEGNPKLAYEATFEAIKWKI